MFGWIGNFESFRLSYGEPYELGIEPWWVGCSSYFNKNTFTQIFSFLLRCVLRATDSVAFHVDCQNGPGFNATVCDRFEGAGSKAQLFKGPLFGVVIWCDRGSAQGQCIVIYVRDRGHYFEKSVEC